MKPLISLIFVASITVSTLGAEWAVLTEQNWDAYAPPGKEADAVLGDYVLKNDKIWAIVAQPAKWRNANMTVKSVGGCLIDFTTIVRPNDQLSAFFPTMRRTFEHIETSPANAPKAVLTLRATAAADKPDMILSYELEDGQSALLIRTILVNSQAAPVDIALEDFYRCDEFQEQSPKDSNDFFWTYDHWFDQAYLVEAEGHRTQAVMPGVAKAVGKVFYVRPGAADSKLTLKPGEKYELVRRIYPADHALAAIGEARKARGTPGAATTLIATNGDEVVPAISVLLKQDAKRYGTARTGPDGTLTAFLPYGKYEATYSGVGYAAQARIVEFEVRAGGTPEFKLPLPKAASVTAEITSESGGPIPAKVQFKGLDETKNPVFGPRTGSTAVMNLCYTANGKFTQKIKPGDYEAIVSYGPEYDVVRVPLRIEEGAAVALKAVLKRAFRTPGWVSADYHSHSTPSGDNTCDQRGRVLNLLCEHIEFAPCTEHNRIDSYQPHLKALGAEKLMGTCLGMELTGKALPLNHQNGFPLIIHPHTQDNGGPQTDESPEVQIRRLAEWDNNSEKLVQQNHPNIGWLFFDKNGDNKPDAGYAEGFKYMNVIEVYPVDTILDMKPTSKWATVVDNNSIFNWLQLLNQGYRIPGVVNTDAHQAFHGSGGVRNFVRCDSEVPGDINPLEIVRHSKKGHLVLSTAPFLNVKLGDAIPGDDISLPGGKGELAVSVQCANWYDIDRVQVLINGRADPKLNFTRQQNPEMFSTGATRFERKIPLALERDAHVIVVAAGSKKLGDVFGPDYGETKPVAVSNPIFVDVDGDGFKPSKDTLDAPLPVKDGAPK